MIADSLISPQIDEVEYPSSDGLPMAETGIHAQTMVLLKQALDDLLASRNANAYVTLDMLWYWERGNPRACKAPDHMVILGAGPHERDSFKSWEEGGKIPDVIFEVASAGTWREDVTEKREVYERRGVREYFIFDPLAEFLQPPLRGYRLRTGYVLETDAGSGLSSEVLQAQLLPEGTMLRLIDRLTSEPVLTRSERIDRERQHFEQERLRAEQERLRAEQERLRAEQELSRADSLASENAKLRDLLRQAGISEFPSPPGS